MTTHSSIHSCEIGARWLGSILGALLVGLVTLIALGEGVPRFSDLPGPVQIQFVAMGLMMGGLFVGWHWETVGGVTALAGFAVFCVVELIANRALPGGAILLFCIPAVLLLLSRWLASLYHSDRFDSHSQ